MPPTKKFSRRIREKIFIDCEKFVYLFNKWKLYKQLLNEIYRETNSI